jgi:uncharacterized protein YdbL (DUF1318 family)
MIAQKRPKMDKLEREHARGVFFLLCLFLVIFSVSAEAAGIKDRMAARIPAINSLKDAGVVGENNLGFLEFRGARQQERLVAEENRDRETVYQAIAKQQKVSTVLVGQRRAKMIADNGRQGHLFQKPDGSWYEK